MMRGSTIFLFVLVSSSISFGADSNQVVPAAQGNVVRCRFIQAAPPRDDSALAAATKDVSSSDSATSQKAIATLRAAGSDGLHAILDTYDKSHDQRLIPTIEAVAGQRGAVVSRLYWYTDLDQAKSAAQAQHKPILYLRLLGKLTDEYSCANSRFFRTALYANAEVSKLMREQFILIWCSERPVPVVTIDYGDGRVLKRTLTGNSIHYILDPDGHVIDALPGLYGPKAFATILNEAHGMAGVVSARPDPLVRYLDRANDSLLREWQVDADEAFPNPTTNPAVAANGAVRTPAAPLAMRLAVSKGRVETPLLASIAPEFAVALGRSIDRADDATWEKVATRHAADAKLDDSSIAVIRGQNPQAYAEAGSLDRTVEQFQKLIALDTVRNNYQFRRQILAWLHESPGKLGVEELNQRVYSELFLTPRSDPWLGLVSENTYSALTNDGCILGQ